MAREKNFFLGTQVKLLEPEITGSQVAAKPCDLQGNNICRGHSGTERVRGQELSRNKTEQAVETRSRKYNLFNTCQMDGLYKAGD